MARQILGIDIQPDGIAAVLASGGIKSVTVEKTAFVQFKKNEPEAEKPQHMTPVSEDMGIKTRENRTSPGESIPQDPLRQALDSIIAQIEPDNPLTLLSLPAGEFSWRNLTLPFSSMKKIRQVLPFEIEPLVPFPVDNLMVEFEPADADRNKTETSVMAVLGEKEFIQSNITMLANRGLSVVSAVPGSWALGKIAQQITPAYQPWGLIDVSRSHGTIIFGDSDVILYTRALRIPVDAEGVANAVTMEAIRTLAGMNERNQKKYYPDVIWVSGTEAEALINTEAPIQGPIQAQIRDRMTPVNLTHTPGSRINISPDAGFDPNRMNTALALLLNRLHGRGGIDFTRGISRQSRLWSDHKSGIWKIAAMILLVLALAGFNLLYDSHALETKHNELDREIRRVFQSTFPKVTKIVDPIRQMRVKIKETSQSTGLPDHSARIRVIDMMNELSRRLPVDIKVTLNRLNFSDNTIIAAGTTDNFNTVDQIKNRLENAELFNNVTISSANTEKSTGRVRFKLKIEIAEENPAS